MPKTFNKFPHNISAAVTPMLKKLLDNERELSSRTLSEIVRESLYEYFEVEEEPTILVRMSPDTLETFRKLGYTK